MQFGTKITAAAPGSAQLLYLVVSDIGVARDSSRPRGRVSGVFHPGAPGAQFQPGGTGDGLAAPSPAHKSYSSFVVFEDPDGNGWLLQEVTDPPPGPVDPTDDPFNSAAIWRAVRRPSSRSR